MYGCLVHKQYCQYTFTFMRLRGPITPGLRVYASSILGPVAGVNISVSPSSSLRREGLCLEEGLRLEDGQFLRRVVNNTVHLVY